MSEGEFETSVDLTQYWATVHGPSDPIGDIEKAMAKIKNERWVCKNCAYTLYRGFSNSGCPDCGGIDWYYTYADKPEV